MKKEYLVFGITATIFAIIISILLFFGVKSISGQNCIKGHINLINNNPECIKIISGCEKTIEITNNCNKDFIILNYSIEDTNIDYLDKGGQIKNLIITLNKNQVSCDYSNLTLKTPENENELIKLNCNNLFIPKDYKTLIKNIKGNFMIEENTQELLIEGSIK